MCAVKRQVPLVRHMHCELSQKAGEIFRICYSRGPQPLGHGPVWVHGLLGTGPHSRKLAAGKTEIMPTPMHGKIVFLETSFWCQKGWGPLCYSIQSSLLSTPSKFKYMLDIPRMYWNEKLTTSKSH